MEYDNLPRRLIRTLQPYLYLKAEGGWTWESYKIMRGRKSLGFHNIIYKKSKNVVIESENDIYKAIKGIMEKPEKENTITGQIKDDIGDDGVEKLKELFDPEDPVSDLVNVFYDARGGYTDEENHPESFNDYPKDVRREAEKILKAAEEGEIDLFEFFDEIVGMRHVGDEKARRLILLSIASLFLGNTEPVHQILKGETGSGKTDLILSVVDIVPKRFVHIIRSSSPLYLFYASTSGMKEARDDYNIYVFDDVKMNDDIIDIAKHITDDRLEEKIHKTVKDQEAISLRIPGKGLCFFSRAQDIPDNELNNRLLYNNPREDETHRKNVIGKVLKGNNNNRAYNRIVEIARAVFEKLIEEPVHVINPWIFAVEVKDPSNTPIRDIKMFKSLVKAITFYRRPQRDTIGRWDHILGTKEDIIDVIKLWTSIDLLERYKLSMKKIQLLKLLKPWEWETVESWRESYKEDREDFELNENAPTYRNLAKKLGVSRGTIMNWVMGTPHSNVPGLVDQGLVEVEKTDPESRTSPNLLFLSKKLIKYKNNNSSGGHENIDLHVPPSIELVKDRLEDDEKERLIYEIPIRDDKIMLREDLIGEVLEDHGQPLEDDKSILEFMRAAEDKLRNSKTAKDQSIVDMFIERIQAKAKDSSREQEHKKGGGETTQTIKEEISQRKNDDGDNNKRSDESIEDRIINYVREYEEKYSNIKGYTGCPVTRIIEDLKIPREAIFHILDELQRRMRIFMPIPDRLTTDPDILK